MNDSGVYIPMGKEHVTKINEAKRKEMFRELLVNARQNDPQQLSPNEIPLFILRDPFQRTYWSYGYQTPFSCACCEDGKLRPCQSYVIFSGPSLYRTLVIGLLNLAAYPFSFRFKCFTYLCLPFTCIAAFILYFWFLFGIITVLCYAVVIDLVMFLVYLLTCKFCGHSVGKFGWFVQYYRMEKYGDTEYYESLPPYSIKRYPLDVCPCCCDASCKRDTILRWKKSAQYDDAWYI